MPTQLIILDHEVQAAMEITRADMRQLVKNAQILTAWNELVCGTDAVCIERDDTTDKPYILSAHDGRRSPIPDRETAAIARVDAIMRRYPSLTYSVQRDPRGSPLHISRQRAAQGE